MHKGTRTNSNPDRPKERINDQHSLHFLAENPTIYTLMELINTKNKSSAQRKNP
jgi:hypothetical protein